MYWLMTYHSITCASRNVTVNLGQNFFSIRFTNPASVIFPKVGKKINLENLFFNLPTLNIICFVEKNNIFF